VRRLAVVVFLVVAVAATYRSFGSEETGTGTLTLPQPAPNEGAPAPQFTVETVEGRRFELSDEGIYVLTFWSSLNLGSDEERSSFVELAREYEDDGVSFAAVYVNSPPRGGDAPYITLQDSTGKLTSLYNVKHVPRLFLIDDGDIEFVHDGYYEDIEKDLEEALKSALEEKS
jgi:thiol-disulfide isomerase/thioredoxin